MTNTDFEKRLARMLHDSCASSNNNHLEHTAFLAKQELRKKSMRRRISFFQFLKRLIQHIGWKIWAGQLFALFFLILGFTSLHSPRLLQTPHLLIRLLFCLSILTAMSSLPLIYRTIHHRMHEIEALTYFSSKELLLAKLMIIGFGDLLLLAGVFTIVLLRTSLTAGNISFYLWVPFLFVSSCLLFMMGHFTWKQFLTASSHLGATLLFIGILIPKRIDWLFTQSFSGGWVLVCILLMAFCGHEFHYILHVSPYAELQIDY